MKSTNKRIKEIKQILVNRDYSKCPICRKDFKSDNCPHNVLDVKEHYEDELLKLKTRGE